MSASKFSSNAQPSMPVRFQPRLPIFGKVPATSSLPASHGARPVQIAVVRNHLPRQCGIATFKTDLCNAIAAEYGPAGLRVAAVSDQQSSYAYSARVRNVIAEGDLSSY